MLLLFWHRRSLVRDGQYSLKLRAKAQEYIQISFRKRSTHINDQCAVSYNWSFTPKSRFWRRTEFWLHRLHLHITRVKLLNILNIWLLVIQGYHRPRFPDTSSVWATPLPARQTRPVLRIQLYWLPWTNVCLGSQNNLSQLVTCL